MATPRRGSKPIAQGIALGMNGRGLFALKLLPLWGVVGVRNYTQGAALGYEVFGLSGRNKWKEGMNMVEWKKLGDLCIIKTGKLNANAQVEDGMYPFFTCDVKPYKIDTYAFDGEAILISGNGNVGHLNYYIGKFNAYQRTYVLMQFKTQSGRYLLHCLNAGFKTYIESKLKKGSVPYITLPLLFDYLIPLPSLSEQERIVGILDTFTEGSNLPSPQTIRTLSRQTPRPRRKTRSRNENAGRDWNFYKRERNTKERFQRRRFWLYSLRTNTCKIWLRNYRNHF